MNKKNLNTDRGQYTPPLNPTTGKPLDKAHVAQLAASIDIHNTQSILTFGSDAQKRLTSVADHMLSDIKSEEIGKAGALLNNMVSLLKGFKGQELQVKRKPNLWDKLLSKPKPIERFLQRFDDVSEQIDRVSCELESRKQQLLIDIKSLDKLYEANLDYYHELEHYIAAAKQVIEHADTHTLPALKSKAEHGDMQLTQQLRDHQMQRDELERRLHDLLLTRQVSMQALPSIRLVQENNKGLVNKINTTLINTVPLWRQQLAQSVAIYRSGEAAHALKHSADLTNELLTTNAENLKLANRESREQFERGVFDIDSVEKANQMLIETIEESIIIHDQARAQRQEAAVRLEQAEAQLKNTLKQVSQHKS